ncbi:MAG: hypothetical protein RLZZ621_354 [Gemmatimonadota bacterium]
MIYNLSTERMLPRQLGWVRCRRALGVLLAVGLLAIGSLVGRPAGAQSPPELAGTWKGTLVNLPARPGASTVEVTIELGALPDVPGRCSPWKTTYREGGAVRGVKDYQLCRGDGATEFFVDEGDGVRLRANLLGDVLVSAFKMGSILLVTHLRVRGDTLEEEIVSITDAPADTGLVTMPARSIQRIVAVRQR